MKVKLLSRVRLLATPRTAAYQAPPTMGFSRQKYWSGVPLPSPSDSYRVVNIKLLLSIQLILRNPKPFSVAETDDRNLD